MQYNPNREHLLTCAECGQHFWTKRRTTARFCSAACRARNHRRRNPKRPGRSVRAQVSAKE